MKILGIDTSTMIATATVMVDGIIIGDYNVNQKKTHSESIVPMIKELLSRLEIKPEEIDLYAVGKGPGSFTGLRIGMSVAKTMAQIFNKPICGISTLEALAWQVVTDNKIIPLLDARGERVYWGKYQWEKGKLISLEKDELIHIDDLMDRLDEEKHVFVGEGATVHKDIILQRKFSIMTPESLNSCIGRGICEIANMDFNAGNMSNSFILVPEYIRKSQAQRDLELREKNNAKH